MRIRVHLRAPPPIVIPLNYSYPLAALIYRLIDHSSADYAAFLHGRSYGVGDRHFKLFAFSPLLGNPRRVVGGHLRFDPDAVSWYLTSPVDDFIRHLVQGILSLGRVEVGGVTFSIDHIERLPEPTFGAEMHFTCLSPITMSTRRYGERWAQYLSPDEPQFVVAKRPTVDTY